MKVALYGATGRIGSRIADEAVRRDHSVTPLSRSVAPAVSDGLVALSGDAGDADDVARIAAEHDVVVSAIGPSRTGGRPKVFLDAVTTLADNVGTRRLIVVGQAGSLQVASGLRLMDTAGFPADLRDEAVAGAASLELLRRSGALVDWLYVSPAPAIGPGERTGQYRIGHDVPIGDFISAEDFAVAIVDEIETPRYRRTRIHVAY